MSFTYQQALGASNYSFLLSSYNNVDNRRAKPGYCRFAPAPSAWRVSHLKVVSPTYRAGSLAGSDIVIFHSRNSGDMNCVFGRSSERFVALHLYKPCLAMLAISSDEEFLPSLLAMCVFILVHPERI